VINGVATDVITVLAADSSFSEICVVSMTDTTATICQNRAPTYSGTTLTRAGITNGRNITDGTSDPVKAVDDIDPGDLIMFKRDSYSALVQVTGVAGQVITFNNGDSLNLNQSAAPEGSVRDYRDTDDTSGVALETQQNTVAANGPIKDFLFTTATRIRMITYYIDATPDPDRPTDPIRPRLVRRMNNGHPTTFNNALGTAVAFDVENFQVSYDLADGALNPTNVKLVLADLSPGGACGASVACDLERVRKVNVMIAGRARRPVRGSNLLYRNSLLTQVSLRSLAFVDKYE
jgi:hypothetical protein